MDFVFSYKNLSPNTLILKAENDDPSTVSLSGGSVPGQFFLRAFQRNYDLCLKIERNFDSGRNISSFISQVRFTDLVIASGSFLKFFKSDNFFPKIFLAPMSLKIKFNNLDMKLSDSPCS